jgi:hypothetical protein
MIGKRFISVTQESVITIGIYPTGMLVLQLLCNEYGVRHRRK